MYMFTLVNQMYFAYVECTVLLIMTTVFAAHVSSLLAGCCLILKAHKQMIVMTVNCLWEYFSLLVLELIKHHLPKS